MAKVVVAIVKTSIKVNGLISFQGAFSCKPVKIRRVAAYARARWVPRWIDFEQFFRWESVGSLMSIACERIERPPNGTVPDKARKRIQVQRCDLSGDDTVPGGKENTVTGGTGESLRAMFLQSVGHRSFREMKWPPLKKEKSAAKKLSHRPVIGSICEITNFPNSR
jgi:hypothetical protein